MTCTVLYIYCLYCHVTDIYMKKFVTMNTAIYVHSIHKVLLLVLHCSAALALQSLHPSTFSHPCSLNPPPPPPFYVHNVMGMSYLDHIFSVIMDPQLTVQCRHMKCRVDL